jgi:hypothetical protein
MAAQARLRSEAMKSFLDEFQERSGPLTEQELAKARRELGL